LATAPPAPSRGWSGPSHAGARCVRSPTSRATRSPAPCGSRAARARGRDATERRTRPLRVRHPTATARASAGSGRRSRPPPARCRDLRFPNRPSRLVASRPARGFVLAWRSRYGRRPFMPSRARALLFCLLAACGRDAFRLPAAIRLEQVVADPSATLDPAARRRDRRWFDERVDLASWGGRDVEIALATDAAGAGPLAGTPGWSHVRLVRESRRARQAASGGAPSVLVVLVDTLRADHLGCYGAAPSPSPVVDRLAAGGLVFEQAVAQSSWTMPSVATLFTGLHPRSHGVVGASADGALAASDPGFL